MPLTFAERKRRIPIGAQKRVAGAAGVPESVVSAVMRDELHPKTEPTREKLRRVQDLLAGEMNLPVEEVFHRTEREAPPTAKTSRARPRARAGR